MNNTRKSKGVIRKVDDLGRTTLVKEYRDILEIKDGDEVEELLVDNEIIIRKVQKSCIVCNDIANENNSIKVNEKIICKKCLLKLQPSKMNSSIT